MLVLALLLAMVIRHHPGGREDAERDHHENMRAGTTGNIVVTLMMIAAMTRAPAPPALTLHHIQPRRPHRPAGWHASFHYRGRVPPRFSYAFPLASGGGHDFHAGGCEEWRESMCVYVCVYIYI